MTDRCNLRCVYCRPDVEQIVEHSRILSYEELSKHKQPELRADLVTIIEKVWEDVVLFGEQ